MEENNELKPEMNNEEQTSTGSSVKDQASKTAKKQIQKRLSGAAKKNALKSSMIKALLPVLTYVLVFIIALIIIIGIVMFFITMPGMVMDKIKELAKDIGNAVASWFGADTTKQVDDVRIYDTLTYLEQMGYDLKGYGFLTDYVGDDDDGVNRDSENDSINEAESDFISNYLISDNYVYTIKNFNMTNDNWFTGMMAHLASLFTGGNANQYWSRGMLDIWRDGGELGKEDSYYDVYEMGSITVDPEKKTLEIKRGWFNNSMKYNLDGWTGRYGMPIDFLLSVHLATMMPDLAYDMATGFETVIKLLLHPVGGGEEDENTAVGYYKVGDDYISYDQFEEFADDGWSGNLGNWYIGKKEAMKIMKEFGIKSPPNCTGTADLDDEEIDSYSEYVSISEDNKQTAVDKYNEMIALLKENGYNPDNESNAENKLTEISSFSQIENKLEDTTPPEDGISEYDFYKTFDTTVLWSKEYEGYQSTFYADVSISYGAGKRRVDGAAAYQVIDFSTFKINADVKRELSEEEIDDWLEEEGISVPEEAKCHNLDEEKCCSACRRYIQKIYDYIKDTDVSDLEIYQPYISRVEDHWYRDVYFVSDKDKEFVTYDYDYEALMKERWTLYETYDSGDMEGEYKLYEIKDDGSYGSLYEGTAEEAAGEGIKVAKKPVKESIRDMADDLSWNEIGNKLSAYEIENVTQEDFQAVYPDVTDEDEDAEIRRNVYVNIITTGNIKQTGEGQRTETNEKIKKMFLKNTYFRYDGSAETAEAITALRNNNDIDYGPLSSSDLNKTATVDGETYKVSDFAGEVSLNQDSLNAFSMLENTHTLDADYIYRDFKELVVELGYFEKEELTDETPRLLQWLIPTTGSYGYPSREIDKNEHEFGTMIHSEGDIKANIKNTLAAAIAMAADEESTSELEVGGSTNTNETNGISAKAKEFDETVKKLNIENQTDFITIGAINSSSSSELLSIEEWWESQQEMFDIFKAESWTYALDHSCATFEDARASRHTTDCSLMASWALQRVGALQEGHTFSSHMGHSGTLDESNVCAQDLLDAGAEVIIPLAGTKFSSAATSGELAPGDVLFYDGHVSIYCGEDYEKGGTTFCWDTGSTTGIQCGGPRDTSYENRDIKLIVRLPLGTAKTPGSPYKGYEGNEAVVSPVTGILLEYGTYTTEKDSTTGEEYRVNVDLKYGTGLLGNNSEPEVENPNEVQTEGRIQVDKVGFAKILVLDKENYKKVESGLLGVSRWDSSFLTSSGNYKNLDNLKVEDVSKDGTWNDVDKTLYGYKEFAERYDEAGISGYVIYIDGFKCELPDEEFDAETSLETAIPSGESIDKDDYFKKVKPSSFDGAGNIEDEDSKLDSLYVQEDEYKMASKKATERLNAESIIKNDAVSSMNIGDLILIKEGTVIGRTITDKELIENYRGESYDTYRGRENQVDPNNQEGEQSLTESLDGDKIIGNYLRIIMRDLEGNVVENVEDYMKLEEGGSGQKGDQEYQFQEGDLDLLADAIHHEGCGAYDDPNGTRDDQLYLATSVGYTIINKVNSDSGYTNAAGMDWAPGKSPLYHVLCVVPCAAHGGKGWYAISDAGTMGGLKNRADANQYEYCDLCFEAAEYIQENDSMNFKNNGKYGAQYSTGEGMPHTCWEQGANYYGNHKIWAQFRSNYLFDTVE